MTYQQRLLRILPKVRYWIEQFNACNDASWRGPEADAYRYSAMRWMDLECRLINRLNGVPRPRR